MDLEKLSIKGLHFESIFFRDFTEELSLLIEKLPEGTIQTVLGPIDNMDINPLNENGKSIREEETVGGVRIHYYSCDRGRTIEVHLPEDSESVVTSKRGVGFVYQGSHYIVDFAGC